VNFQPLEFEQPVHDFLNRVFLGGAPAEFTVGRECRMQDATDAASIVRWSNFDLSDHSIRDHVANGMRLTHLAIVYDNMMSFVLSESGVITKMKFLGMDDDNEDHGDALAEFDANSVPLYVVFGPDPSRKPVVLQNPITAGVVVEALEKIGGGG